MLSRFSIFFHNWHRIQKPYIRSQILSIFTFQYSTLVRLACLYMILLCICCACLLSFKGSFIRYWKLNTYICRELLIIDLYFFAYLPRMSETWEVSRDSFESWRGNSHTCRSLSFKRKREMLQKIRINQRPCYKAIRYLGMECLGGKTIIGGAYLSI